jgi:antitoxin (DNA-binding transcriptional repressor) of toxin-antitoxin stability system
MDPLQVNIHEAKTNLSKLIQSALDGREVIIAKGNKPVVRLEVLPEARGGRKIGNAKGMLVFMADDFDEPLEDFEEYMQ